MNAEKIFLFGNKKSKSDFEVFCLTNLILKVWSQKKFPQTESCVTTTTSPTTSRSAPGPNWKPSWTGIPVRPEFGLFQDNTGTRMMILRDHSWPLFLYFRLFNTVDSKQMFNKIFANGHIQTADLWHQKRPLYQLSHNHWPEWCLTSSKCYKTFCGKFRFPQN